MSKFFLFLAFIFTLVLLSKWASSELEAMLYSEKKLAQVKTKHGVKISKRMVDWKKFVQQNQNKSEKEKLELTNDFFNKQLKWVEDRKLWKKKDYWATPIETLIKNAGDCEDFTIIKYFTLTSLGIPIEHLKLTYVKSLEYNQAHMVLTYTETKRSVPLVLDNINKKILPASQRHDLRPVYSFNGEGLWLQEPKKTVKKLGSSSQIRLWVDLTERMRKELL